MKKINKKHHIMKIRAKLKSDFGLADSYYFTKYKDIKKYFKFFNKIIFKNILLRDYSNVYTNYNCGSNFTSNRNLE